MGNTCGLCQKYKQDPDFYLFGECGKTKKYVSPHYFCDYFEEK